MFYLEHTTFLTHINALKEDTQFSKSRSMYKQVGVGRGRSLYKLQCPAFPGFATLSRDGNPAVDSRSPLVLSSSTPLSHPSWPHPPPCLPTASHAAPLQLIALEVQAYSMALLDFVVQHASRPIEEWLVLVPHFMHEAAKTLLMEGCRGLLPGSPH